GPGRPGAIFSPPLDLKRKFDHGLHFSRASRVLRFSKGRQGARDPAYTVRRICKCEVVGDRAKIIGTVEQIEGFETEVEALTFLGKHPVQSQIGRGIARTNECASAKERRS